TGNGKWNRVDLVRRDLRHTEYLPFPVFSVSQVPAHEVHTVPLPISCVKLPGTPLVARNRRSPVLGNVEVSLGFWRKRSSPQSEVPSFVPSAVTSRHTKT